MTASGQQVELRSGHARAVVACVGASVRRLVVGERDVLDGYGDDDIAAYAQGQALVPWPNRLADGRYEFGGETLQVALTEPEKHNAIHGLARWAAWEVAERSGEEVTLRHAVMPQAGYPFALGVAVTYRLEPGGLSVRVEAVNEGTRPLPYGAGFHPYLLAGTPAIDDAELHIPAAVRLASDDRGIPTGERLELRGTEYDFATPRVIGGTQLDTAFGDLERDGDGRARVALRDPASGWVVELWMDEAFRYVMAFTGDGLPDPARRRRSLGVEPMTCPPNAFASGHDVAVLDRGERHVAEWGLAWRDGNGSAG